MKRFFSLLIVAIIAAIMVADGRSVTSPGVIVIDDFHVGVIGFGVIAWRKGRNRRQWRNFLRPLRSLWGTGLAPQRGQVGYFSVPETRQGQDIKIGGRRWLRSPEEQKKLDAKRKERRRAKALAVAEKRHNRRTRRQGKFESELKKELRARKKARKAVVGRQPATTVFLVVGPTPDTREKMYAFNKARREAALLRAKQEAEAAEKAARRAFFRKIVAMAWAAMTIRKMDQESFVRLLVSQKVCSRRLARAAYGQAWKIMVLDAIRHHNFFARKGYTRSLYGFNGGLA